METDFIQRLKNISKEIDKKLSLEENLKIREEKVFKNKPIFAIYKRTPTGSNKILFSGLTRLEAIYKYEYLNILEQEKRKRKEQHLQDQGLEYKPDVNDLVLFDIVEIGTNQENPYWNPKEVLK